MTDAWSGHEVQAVHGPEGRTAEIVSTAIGRRFHVKHIADDAVRGILRGSGTTAGLVEAVPGVSTGLRDGFVPEQPRTVRTTTPASLPAWASAELRPPL